MTAFTDPYPHVPVTGAADLWCTYAAVRTLSWLGRVDEAGDRSQTTDYLRSRRNADGGFAWSKGMPSDAWATFYCTAALSDLGEPPADRERTAAWLRRTWSGAAYAMTPGQAPDVWATHFSTRSVIEFCDEDVPDRRRLLEWLGSLQTADGGLSWSPEHARAADADVRACYYGIATWRALNSREPATQPWDTDALVAWLLRQQVEGAGFRFGPEAEVPCLWATYRAVAALAILGSAPEASGCADWILGQFDGAGFTRWPGYPVADVWAAFCAVGALKELIEIPGDVADAVVKGLAAMACPGGGFTYREPERAADALRVAAAALTAPQDDPVLPRLRRWLEGCQLPNEGGLMYMPGRGAEVRCTLWALAAGAFRENPQARRVIRAWLMRLQNPDGGFGFWHGRGSDLVSTASAVEAWRLLDGAEPSTVEPSTVEPSTVEPSSADLNRAALTAFIEACDKGSDEDGLAYGNVPGAPATLRSGLHAARILAHLGRVDAGTVAALLERHRVRGGGWANEGNRLPDLISTYEAVVTADRVGIPVSPDGVSAFLDRTTTPHGGSWSPLAPASDALADCLHRLLRRRLTDPHFVLPALSLS